MAGQEDPSLRVADAVIVGDNSRGYQFAVGKIADDRWVGFAIGRVEGQNKMLFFFSEIADADYRLGILDRDEAIRMTSAIADDPEHAYGGIERWFADPALRATSDQYRCANCGTVACQGACLYADPFDYDDEEGTGP